MSVVPLRRIGPVAAAVCALHALLLGWALSLRVGVDRGAPQAPAMSTRWLAAPPAPERDVTPVAQGPERGSVRRVRRAAETTVQPAVVPQTTPAELPSPESTEPVAAEPALRADSVQRAARETARQKGLAARVDEQLGRSPVNAQTALREGMASGARGDCLKGGEGGYANAGMGLLALPLLVLDAARGRCE